MANELPRHSSTKCTDEQIFVMITGRSPRDTHEGRI